MRKRTGLRNRFRTGRSTYSGEHKSVGSDRYGEYTNGIRKTGEVVAGSNSRWKFLYESTQS